MPLFAINMAAMPTRDDNRLYLQRQVVQAATSLCASKPLSVISARDLAELLGVSHQTLYNQFGSIGRIYALVLADHCLAWQAEFDNVTRFYEGDLMHSIGLLLERQLDCYVSQDPEAWQRVISDAALTPGVYQSPLTLIDGRAQERLNALLSLARGTGQVSASLDLQLMAHTLFCLSDRCLMQLTLDSEATPVAVQRVYNEQCRMLFA